MGQVLHLFVGLATILQKLKEASFLEGKRLEFLSLFEPFQK